MRKTALFALCMSMLLVFSGARMAQAQCALPYTITNTSNADANQVMANLNALASCFNMGGSTNAIQYNGGSGLAGIGPLTNGQLLVGSTGNPPQAQTLTAGTGISITNGAGNITISASSPIGLYRQVMSATPTSAGTGLTTWLNQGTSTVADTAVGVSMNVPTSGTSANIVGRYMNAPSTPYTITALIAATRNSSSYNGAGIGWYDGANKLHILSYTTVAGSAAFLEVTKWNSVTSYNGPDFQSSQNAFSQPIWLQIQDNGTNVSFGFSQDGTNFISLFSVAKSSGWLGSSGYSKVIFFVNPQGSQTLGTIMSWVQS